MQFLPLLAVFGIDDILLYLAIASAVTGTAASYAASQQQQKQVKAQADMNAKAMAEEQQRKAAELAANQQRLALQQKRARAQQLAQQASTGFQLDTGSPLAVMADTYATQAQEQADLSYMNDVQQRALGWEGTQAGYAARQQAAALKSQQTAGLISGISNIARQGYTISSNTPGPYGNTGGATAMPSSYQPRKASERPY